MSESSESFDLRRRDIVAAILAKRGDALVIGGLGSAAWDITAAGDSPLNFPLWGAMGGTVAIALGLAIAQPGRRVLALSGDGDLLMGIGSLATVAVQAPGNLAIVALDNERYGETGMQETPRASTSPASPAPAASSWRRRFATRRNSPPPCRRSTTLPARASSPSRCAPRRCRSSSRRRTGPSSNPAFAAPCSATAWAEAPRSNAHAIVPPGRVLAE